MKFALKGLLREMWQRPARSTQGQAPQFPDGIRPPGGNDEELLEDPAPYKLEPSLAEGEAYLARIRRGGW